MTLKITDKKLFGQNCILYHEEIKITGVFLGIRDPDPETDLVFSRIRVTQKDRLRQEPDSQH